MIEQARVAVPDDGEALRRLHRSATDELRAQRGGEVWARQTARAEGLPIGADPDELLLVGTIDDAVIGYGRAVATRLVDGGELAVLTDIYVEEDARGVGVGAAILDAAIAWATDRGCIGIDSIALPGMRDTKNFFEAAGMVARAIVVHRRLL